MTPSTERAPARADGRSGQVEIRSYRNVFALERRLYKIDELPLNPAGVPLRGIAYFAVLCCMALLIGRLRALAWMPWYLSDLFAPAALAFVLCSVRIDGRPFHLSALAWLTYRGARVRERLRRAVPADAPRGIRERDRRLLLLCGRGAARSLHGRTFVVLARRRNPTPRAHPGRAGEAAR